MKSCDAQANPRTAAAARDRDTQTGRLHEKFMCAPFSSTYAMYVRYRRAENGVREGEKRENTSLASQVASNPD